MGKNRFVSLLFVIFTSLKSSSATASQGPIGYARETTGGQGGGMLIVNSARELKAAAESEGRKVIYVNGNQDGGHKGLDIIIKSDKSIIGMGKGATLDGIGFQVNSVKNIIFQNLRFTFLSLKNSPKKAIGDDQIIALNEGLNMWIGLSSNIWIDHCEFYNEEPLPEAKMHSIYHAFIGFTKSQNITMSYNHFHDMGRSFGFGASLTEDTDWRLTMHHNLWEKLQQRNPRVTGGTGHLFNNYYRDIYFYCVNSANEACLKVENNVFEKANNPMVGHQNNQKQGGMENINNQITNAETYIEGNRTAPACSLKIDYPYHADQVDKVKELVLKNAGTKLNITAP